MRHKKPQRITLAEFVQEFGAVQLAKLCGVDRTAPHKWAKGVCSPSLAHCETILKAAKGRLTLSDLQAKKGGAQ